MTGLSLPLLMEYCIGLPVCVLLGIRRYSSGDIRVSCMSVSSLLSTTSRASMVEDERSYAVVLAATVTEETEVEEYPCSASL